MKAVARFIRKATSAEQRSKIAFDRIRRREDVYSFESSREPLIGSSKTIRWQVLGEGVIFKLPFEKTDYKSYTWRWRSRGGVCWHTGIISVQVSFDDSFSSGTGEPMFCSSFTQILHDLRMKSGGILLISWMFWGLFAHLLIELISVKWRWFLRSLRCSLLVLQLTLLRTTWTRSWSSPALTSRHWAWNPPGRIIVGTCHHSVSNSKYFSRLKVSREHLIGSWRNETSLQNYLARICFSNRLCLRNLCPQLCFP